MFLITIYISLVDIWLFKFSIFKNRLLFFSQGICSSKLLNLLAQIISNISLYHYNTCKIYTSILTFIPDIDNQYSERVSQF